MKEEELFAHLFTRHPALEVCRENIHHAYEIMAASYEAGGKLLTCGNGGSAADSEHIVGELMKGFVLPRRVESGALGGRAIQGALRAISLVSNVALTTAIANDNGADLVFAQQVMGYGVKGDVLLGLSTSGNSPNVVNAMLLAGERGLKTIALTGEKGGRMAAVADCAIRVPAVETYEVQEYHLPVYHCLCLMLEERFYGA